MVYVDDLNKPYRGMLMSHMIADSHSELIRMIDSLGLERKHIQFEGCRKEHYDICKSKKNLAIKLGAVPITKRELAKKISSRDYQQYDF